jgi:hypothetical protein
MKDMIHRETRRRDASAPKAGHPVHPKNEADGGSTACPGEQPFTSFT